MKESATSPTCSKQREADLESTVLSVDFPRSTVSVFLRGPIFVSKTVRHCPARRISTCVDIDKSAEGVNGQCHFLRGEAYLKQVVVFFSYA